MPGQLNQQRVGSIGRLSNISSQSYQSQFMNDAVKKKSKLEMEQENSKKRLYTEISKGDSDND